MSQWTHADVIALSDERDRWVALALDYWRQGFEAGRAYEARQSPPMCTQLDFNEPGGWPVRSLGPLPKVDPRLDRRRYPPHGRQSWLLANPRHYRRRGEWQGTDNGAELPRW